MKLTVKPLKQKDAGRGLAAIHKQDMETLGVENGDYVRITADDSPTIARVWSGYPEDSPGLIRIDGQLRQDAGVGIDDTVTVEQARVPLAESITIALPEDLNIRGDIGPHLHDRLNGQAVSQGQTLSFSIGMLGAGNQTTAMTIVDTQPDEEFVVIGEATTVNVSDKPVEEFEEEGGEDGDSKAPNVTYEDIGGLNEEIEQVREMVELPLTHPELFDRVGIEPPKGVLLHGPPGTGKTLIAQAVANEVDATFFSLKGPEIMSKYYGETEEQLRTMFEEAEEEAPTIIFLDEIDSLAPERGDGVGEVENRVVSQLLSLMDGLEDRGEVIVIAATNRVDDIDPALRRGGRFDREIEIGVPDRDGRKETLEIHTRGMALGDSVDISHFADNTHGFVGADLETLVKEAAMNALERVKPELNLDTDEETLPPGVIDSLRVTQNDFKEALKDVEPSAFREVFVEIPDVEWDDVGGLEDAKARLQETIEWPLDYPDLFDDYDVDAAKGILMHGPPGTGKTLLAKAVANESNCNFISLKGPELLSKWVGESEEGVREVFSKARENAPTIIFFDEIDAITTERGQNNDGGSAVTERVVSQLLTELDGLEELEDVVVIATTNRREDIDDALLRPGRIEKEVMVGLPEVEARRAIFEVHTKDKPVSDDVDLDWLAENTDGYVGADIEAVCREAAMAALREDVQQQETGEQTSRSPARVEEEHFERTLANYEPLVDEEMRREYGIPLDQSSDNEWGPNNSGQGDRLFPDE